MRIGRILDFPVLVNHRVKFKESKKKDKYLDLTENWKNCGTWKWRLYQLKLVLLERSPKDRFKDWRT